MRFAVKVLLVVGLFGAGLWLLLAHAGLLIPHVSYKGLDAYGLPVGIALMVIGVAVLFFWRISEETETTTTTRRGSGETTVTKTTKATKTYFRK
jgi:hypothetical protein